MHRSGPRRITTSSSRRRRSRCVTSRASTAPTANRQFETYSRVNVGIAVAADDALRRSDDLRRRPKSLAEIAGRLARLAARVRDGSITPAELRGGTFTVSNLGMYGVDSFSAVINPPQAAILAVGSLKPRPVVDDNGRRRRPPDGRCSTLACDHRILYGADGAALPGTSPRAARAPGRAVRLVGRRSARLSPRLSRIGCSGSAPARRRCLGSTGLRPSSTSTFSGSSTRPEARRQLEQRREVDLVAVSASSMPWMICSVPRPAASVPPCSRAASKPEVEVLEQQLRRECRREVEIDVRRRLVSGERRAHHAVVEELEEVGPRDAPLLGQHGDLSHALRDHAEHQVVADLHQPCALALADVGDAAGQQLQIRPRLLPRLARAPMRRSSAGRSRPPSGCRSPAPPASPCRAARPRRESRPPTAGRDRRRVDDQPGARRPARESRPSGRSPPPRRRSSRRPS